MRRRAASISRLEWLTLAALALLALAVQAELALKIAREGGVLVGSDGLELPDQAQYLAWVRLASDGLLIGNPFDLAPGQDVWLHPGFAISGLLHALGLSPGLALLAWKPVAVALLFAGAAAYAGRSLKTPGRRGAALVLALLGGSPILAGIQLEHLLSVGVPPAVFSSEAQAGSIARELSPLHQLWGYPFAALTVGLMPVVLLAYERARRRMADGGAALPPLTLACAGALVCTWIHPWQGATLVLTVVLAELWPGRDRLRAGSLVRLLLPLGAAAALPAVYTLALASLSSDWERVREFTEQGLLRWDYLIAGLLPLGLLALAALRLPAPDFGQRALRAWPAAALLVYVAPGLSFRQHALEGLSIPLSVLAVQGVAWLVERQPWGSVGMRRGVLGAGVALMVVPFCAASLLHLHYRIQRDDQPHVIAGSEAAALDALEDLPAQAGVLATTRLGQLVPGRSGRETWLGPAPWTPAPFHRRAAVDGLFGGRLTPAAAQSLVRRTGAGVVLEDCRSPVDLARALGPLVRRTRRFGCAALWEVGPR